MTLATTEQLYLSIWSFRLLVGAEHRYVHHRFPRLLLAVHGPRHWQVLNTSISDNGFITLNLTNNVRLGFLYCEVLNFFTAHLGRRAHIALEKPKVYIRV